MKKSLSVLCLVGLCCVCLSSRAADPVVSASLERDHIGASDTVRLMVQHNGAANAPLDISPLKADFDIVSSNRGTSVQINNGAMTEQTQVELVLAPKHTGTIQIPALAWGGDQTQPLQLNVAAKGSDSGQSGDANDAQHVMLTAVADQTQPYVQAAVVLTVRLATDQPISQASLELAPNDAVLVSQLGTDQHANETHNGHRYQVIERKYLLFPQHSGHLKLDGPVLAATVIDTNASGPFDSDPFFADMLKNSPLAGMMHSTKPLRLRAKPIELDVQPRPASQTGADWLPALSVKLSESWPASSGAIHVGDPIERHISLQAVGQTGAQLPDLTRLIAVPDGVRLYPDQAKIATQPKGDSVIGSREQDVALIASQPGHFTIPPLRLTWWDTINNVAREATLPAHEFDVLPAAGGAVTAAQTPAAPTVAKPTSANPTATVASAAGPTARSARLMWGVLLCSVVALGALLARWLLRRPERQAPALHRDDTAPRGASASASFKEFQRACMDNDAQGARQHLMEWARLYWPLDPPAGLNALGQRLDDVALMTLLRELDRCCYTATPWNGANLAGKFASAPAKKAGVPAVEELRELYP